MAHPVYTDSRKLALYWHLRELAEGTHEDDPAGTSYHEDTIAAEALREDDVLAALERIRHEAWRPVLERQHAADLIAEYCWPADAGHQPATWHTSYIQKYHELEARRRMGTYSPPVSSADHDGRTGYHWGGIWFPDIPSAKPLTCPECGFSGEFWDYTAVDKGTAHEPTLVCHCGWAPPEKPLSV